MRVRARSWIERYEAFLRIDDTLSPTVRTRARILCLTGWAFTAIQLLNMALMFVIYQGWDPQHAVSIGACCVFMGLTHALRWTKSPTFYGMAYGLLALGAVGFSATAASTEIHASGINTPLLVMIIAAMALVCYIGTRLTVIAYGIGSILLIWGLYQYTVATGIDEAQVIFAQQRAIQCGLSMVITGAVTLFTSHLVYRTLDNQEATIKRAREAEDARSGLMATMTHEIRTPLNGIVAVSDMLSRNPSLDAHAKASLDLVQLSSSALMDIVNRTLDRAKSDANDLTLDVGPFDLAELIESTCELFRASARERNLWIGSSGLETLAPLGRCQLVGDAAQLRQVLSNLIGNALKFTETGGVRVGVRSTTPPDDMIDAHLRDELSLMFFVQDTGVGIARDDQARVFERFAQSASGAAARDKGTGLGLAISRDMVEAMGGRLDLQSEPGKGAVFFFTLILPLADGQADTAVAA